MSKLHRGLEHCPDCGMYTPECSKMWRQIRERCCEACAKNMRAKHYWPKSVEETSAERELKGLLR